MSDENNSLFLVLLKSDLTKTTSDISNISTTKGADQATTAGV